MSFYGGFSQCQFIFYRSSLKLVILCDNLTKFDLFLYLIVKDEVILCGLFIELFYVATSLKTMLFMLQFNEF